MNLELILTCCGSREESAESACDQTCDCIHPCTCGDQCNCASEI
jgi:hypothetical protein